jgi:hypothetical protein
LTQSQIDPPVTANRAERRSSTRKRRVPLALVLGPVALVLVGVVLILVLGGGSAGLPGIIGGSDDNDEVPPFEFRLGKTGVVATVEGADVDVLKTAAEPATAAVATVIDDLYTNAFLDPTNWREGDYEEILALFSDEAAPAASENLETLTLGAGAGDVYEAVTPNKGSLTFEVLFDPEGNPHTVVVSLRFYALGERTDGTWTSIISAGDVFLQDLGGWKITAFELRRGDKETDPPASPSPSASTSASGASR